MNSFSKRTSIKTQIYTQHTDYQPYKQLEFVCMAGVLWSKIAEFVCVKYNICPDFSVLFVYNSLPLQTCGNIVKIQTNNGLWEGQRDYTH